MEAKPVNTLVEEFEPLCKWKRMEDRDILEIYLQEFKKEQLSVQIRNSGILKISGERPLIPSGKSKFYKEVPIPKNIESNAIRAKFVNGCLYIAMPKKIPIPAAEAAEPPHEDQTKKETQNGSKEETFAVAKSAVSSPTVSEFQQRKRAVWPRLRTVGKVVVTLAALAVLIAYVVYMYRSMVPQDDEYL